MICIDSWLRVCLHILDVFFPALEALRIILICNGQVDVVEMTCADVDCVQVTPNLVSVARTKSWLCSQRFPIRARM